eukprot:354249-Chlamydomonas_euryale.AAC.2
MPSRPRAKTHALEAFKDVLSSSKLPLESCTPPYTPLHPQHAHPHTHPSIPSTHTPIHTPPSPARTPPYTPLHPQHSRLHSHPNTEHVNPLAAEANVSSSRRARRHNTQPFHTSHPSLARARLRWAETKDAALESSRLAALVSDAQSRLHADVVGTAGAALSQLEGALGAARADAVAARAERRAQERKTTAAMLLTRLEDRRHERAFRALATDMPDAVAERVRGPLGGIQEGVDALQVNV